MINPRLITGAAAVALCLLAGCAGRSVEGARGWQAQNAECQKFGAKSGTRAFRNCKFALRAIESMERVTLSSTPPRPTQAMGAGSDGGRVGGRDLWTRESGCGRIRAGQLLVFDCGLHIPITDLLGGLDP